MRFLPRKLNLNVRLILIFIACLAAATITFFLTVFYFTPFEDYRKQEKLNDQVKERLDDWKESMEAGNVSLADRDGIEEALGKVKGQHEKEWGFLVTDAEGNVAYRAGNLYSDDLSKLLEEKLSNGATHETDVMQAPFITMVSFPEGLGYVVIEAPLLVKVVNPTTYNQQLIQLILAFALAVVVFLILFVLFMRPVTRYIEQIESGIGRIVDHDWTYEIPVKGRDELSSLAANINWMTDQLRLRFERERELEQSKSELITNLSHDLRTPLTSIIGYLQLAKDQESPGDKGYVDTTYRLSLKLKGLMDELFEYTKLTHHQVELQTDQVDFAALLHQLVGEYTPILEGKGLRVEMEVPEEPVLVTVDIEKMIRVFDNLLSNVEKYSLEGTIKLRMKVEGDRVLTSLSNPSDPVDPEELHRLFDQFYRLDEARSTKIAGSGLGLAIAKRIVELHEGEIWAESGEGELTVWVALPVRG
ncbi:HAMP domain-containing sensor histidine kinase [Rossellomorea marisflavi]|jgi:signal transduction histidine kinase|uniref:sensor histidine kinase n=1 Tax=Rossellomorea marisflavi TaxID=189381 RepID=UPI00285341CD|nr:HAMP domain-containing sensor histidine kinase [Rossellomorea marisflavi]MDR4938157.1 HAMP domain-containing sensor histidine kinase [Rossellomorea marisflavi]